MNKKIKTIEQLSQERVRYIINEYCDGNRMEFSKRTGIGKSSISQYVNGTNAPGNITAAKIGDAFGLNPMWIMGFDAPMILRESISIEEYSDLTNLSFPAARPIPILGTICAGDGVFCEDNYSGYFFVDNSIRADLCLTVRGDSMIGIGIQDGDIAFIRKTDIVTNGKVYAVRINNDSEAVLKSVYIDGDTVVLNSANTDYAPIMTDTSNISIIGSLIGIYHSLK